MKGYEKAFTAILVIGIFLHIIEEDTAAIIFTIWSSAFCIYLKMDCNNKDNKDE